MGICMWCNTDDDEHDLQHLARYCYPEQVRQQREYIDDLNSKFERQREALQSIAKVASPGSRTLDDMLRDMGYVCDAARLALNTR